MKYLIKNAEIVDIGFKSKADIYIEDGVVKEIGKGLRKTKAVPIEAEGCLALPLFVDLHAHLRTPGEEQKEDLNSGLKAALKGGYHTVVSMPNTSPPVDAPEIVSFLLARAGKIGMADLKVAAAITEGLKGEKKAPLKALYEAGASAFSDDGRSVSDSKIVYLTMLEAKQLGVPLFLHEEDYSLSNSSGINEGRASFVTGVFGNHPLSEAIPVARDLLLARATQARVHVQHVSSQETLEVLKLFKAENVTAEVTPHHLIFDEEHTLSLDPLYKTNPPLRSKGDKEALIEAVKSGLIDCIATDHAPHALEDKQQPYESAKPGMAWFELVFPALYTKLVLNDILSLEEIVKLLNVNPSRILKINRPEIKTGKPASFALFEVSKKNSLQKLPFYSKAKNNPLFGEELYGFTKVVFKDGKLKVVDGMILEGED